MFYWISESIEFLKKNYLHAQICSFCRLLLEEETILTLFDPHLTPRVPQKGQNLRIVLNKLQYQISGDKLFLWANLQLLGGYF